ncbi:putative sarcosine oxidase [Aspergillus novofumigatus IBT 16806]|uniref:sarcosine oxidasee (formaldehyde-forming) n=1 Tax=Aspergillus novofumigatus (strain IBT 16806) TaxID=1392255 RepID=A0A2I1BV94_ASPN1|nr:putative FAD dependent oxidoreductase [Aspergillus novofumigatus IBT 16806]PKX89310.1 putative FAD dependent oxidoreductase [Aspergillus novofumigatus IBT 16806]
MEHFDVAVVGLGVLGSGAAYYAAKKGAKVIAFEQFELGHVRGASHDTSRIVRTSNFAPEYVALAKSAYKDWAELEKVTGYEMLTTTGGVVFFAPDSPTSASDFARSLDTHNVPYELLDAQEVKSRWPQFNIPDGVSTVYTADSGVAHAAKTVSTLQSLARSHGAILKDNAPVERLTPQVSGGVIIETPKGRFQAGKVILATDAWINKLLAPLSVHIPVTVMQEQVTYFKPTNSAAFEPDRFPVWIWYGANCFYGFPCYGEPTIKAGRDYSNNLMTPEQRTFVHSPQLLEELTSFMNGFIPDKDRQPLRTITCQYTITPDRRFIISPLENYPDIIVGLGAAHAFKFAPAFGRVLAELAVDGRTNEDISQWGIPKGATRNGKL